MMALWAMGYGSWVMDMGFYDVDMGRWIFWL